VVDDDPSVLKSVRRLLESEGFGVSAFAHPDEALDYMETHPIPLAVLDIWMQEMTGMELLAHLCARSPETHVIFITGHEDRAAESTVMQAGAFAFFLKPLDDARFLAAVHRALGDPLPPENAGLVERTRALLKDDRSLSKNGPRFAEKSKGEEC